MLTDLIPYTEMKKNVFARGSVPDGYLGERQKCEFAFYQNHVITVWDKGYCYTNTPPAMSISEALYNLQNRPWERHNIVISEVLY